MAEGLLEEAAIPTRTRVLVRRRKRRRSQDITAQEGLQALFRLMEKLEHHVMQGDTAPLDPVSPFPVHLELMLASLLPLAVIPQSA